MDKGAEWGRATRRRLLCHLAERSQSERLVGSTPTLLHIRKTLYTEKQRERKLKTPSLSFSNVNIFACNRFHRSVLISLLFYEFINSFDPISHYFLFSQFVPASSFRLGFYVLIFFPRFNLAGCN